MPSCNAFPRAQLRYPLLRHADCGFCAADFFFVLSSELGVGKSDENPLQVAGELERDLVVLADRRAGVLADIQGFVNGHAERSGPLDAAFGDRLVVHGDR